MKSISEVAKCVAMPDAYYLQSPGRKSTLCLRKVASLRFSAILNLLYD